MDLLIVGFAARSQRRVCPHPRVAVVGGEVVEPEPGRLGGVGDDVGVGGVANFLVGDEPSVSFRVECADFLDFPVLPRGRLGGSGTGGCSVTKKTG